MWRVLAWPLGLLIAAWARLVRATSRVSVGGPGAGLRGAAIYVNWHRHLPFLVGEHGRARRWILVSPAPRLAPIAAWCRLSGLRIARGASGAGGGAALETLRALLERGESIVLAADGPAGPLFRAKPGCVALAAATGAPIVPVGYTARRGVVPPWRWDRGLYPIPLDEVAVRYGEPLRVAAGEPAGPALERVNAALDALEPAAHPPSPSPTSAPSA